MTFWFQCRQISSQSSPCLRILHSRKPYEPYPAPQVDWPCIRHSTEVCHTHKSCSKIVLFVGGCREFLASIAKQMQQIASVVSTEWWNLGRVVHAENHASLMQPQQLKLDVLLVRPGGLVSCLGGAASHSLLTLLASPKLPTSLESMRLGVRLCLRAPL